jgi:hypothetical protein
MKIFETYFEPGVVVVTMTNDKGTIVRAFTPRTKPTWLHTGEKNKPDPVVKVKLKKDNEQLKLDLLRLVRVLPGKAKSFYTQLGMDEGGVKGSQERKEKALEELINANQIKRVQLEKAVGRKNHELYAV